MAESTGWPNLRGDRINGVTELTEWPNQRGGRSNEVAEFTGWPNLRGGRINGVAESKRWPNQRGGRINGVALRRCSTTVFITRTSFCETDDQKIPFCQLYKKKMNKFIV